MENESAAVSEAEVEAALAEAQAHAEAIPSLDDDRPAIVPVPITSHLRPLPRSASEPAAPPTGSVTAASASTTAPQDAPGVPADVAAAHGLLYRLLDRILWALNRPFAFLGPGGRHVLGWIAIVTLIMCALALTILPRLALRRDPLSELHQYTQRALSASAERPAAEDH